MDWQTILDNAMEAERAEKMKTSRQLTLGELILKLEAITDKSKPIIFDETHHPDGIDSWRGSYRELTITYDNGEARLTTASFLELLKGAIGATFYGYKGGEFLMGKTTPVWVANYGQSEGFTHEGEIWTQAVVDVTENEQSVILVTQNIDY